MDNYSNMDTSIQLDTLNAEEVSRLSPLLLFLSLILLTGLPGNLLVILVYRRSYRNSNSKMFVLWLAIIDLLNCLILSLEIVNVTHQYNYPDESLCKITIFITLWPTLASGISLCAISFERFRKVCTPLGWQISHRNARIVCLLIVIFCFLASCPSLVLFGLRDIYIPSHNITGHECMFKNEYDGTASLRIYSGLLWLLFVFSLAVLVLFYTLIGRKVYTQIQKHHGMPSPVARPSFSNQGKDDIKSISCIIDVSPSTSSALEDRHSRVVNPNVTVCPSVSRQNSARQTQAKRSAFIMFLISLIFFISFIPHLVLRLLESMDETFVSDMSDSGRAAYKFFLRSYFLNCASNPFIYCVFLPQFRSDVVNRVRGMWRR